MLYDRVVKWLRHSPFTATSGVRISARSPEIPSSACSRWSGLVSDSTATFEEAVSAADEVLRTLGDLSDVSGKLRRRDLMARAEPHKL